jgi:ankyrin repeat protein
VDLRSPQKVEAALNDLPRDLDETYDRILRKIPAEDKHDTIRLLQFLAHSHMRTTVEEAVEIIATDTNAERPSFNIKGRIADEEDIRRYGLGLISITVTTDVFGIVRREVRLAHFSVKEFLHKRPDFSQLIASIAITKTCLTYLGDITGGAASIQQNSPFGRTAAEIWTRHGASAEKDDDVFKAIMWFLEDEETFSRWDQLVELDSPPWEPHASTESRLYHACIHGLTRVAQALLAKGADVNTKGGYYGNALQAASVRGHLEAVDLLLEKGADVNVQGGYYGNALQAASAHGHLEGVKLLLEKGADVMLQGGLYGNVLEAGAANGHLEIVAHLLQKGIDINMQGERLGNALAAATNGKNTKLVRFLVKMGADVNARSASHRPLCLASFDGCIELMEFFLEKGADINARDDVPFDSALHAAAFAQHVEAVKFLVEKGADVHQQGSFYGSALAAASTFGRDNSETANYLRQVMAATEDKNEEPSHQGSGLLGNDRQSSRSPKRRRCDK